MINIKYDPIFKSEDELYLVFFCYGDREYKIKKVTIKEPLNYNGECWVYSCTNNENVSVLETRLFREKNKAIIYSIKRARNKAESEAVRLSQLLDKLENRSKLI